MFHSSKGYLLAAVHAMNVAAVIVELNEANSSLGAAQNNPFGVIYGLLVWIKSLISLVDKQRFFFASIVGSIYSTLCSLPLSRLTFLWATWKGLTSRKLTTSGMCSHFIARMEYTTFPHVVWSVGGGGSILVVATATSMW